MTRYVALLRAVNVSGHNMVSMPALRQLFESLGYDDVSTYIQSGNVIFGAPAKVDPARLSRALHEELGVDTPVVVRTATQMRAVAKVKAFPNVDVGKVSVGFLTAKPTAAKVRALDHDRYLPEEFVVRGTEVFVHLPNGTARQKVLTYVAKQLGTEMTVRNWKSVTKLAELAAG